MTGNCRSGWRCCTVKSHSHKVRRRRNRARVGFVRPSDTGELRLDSRRGLVALQDRRCSLCCFCSCSSKLGPRAVCVFLRWEWWLWRWCLSLCASWASVHIKTARGAGLHSPWGRQALRKGDPENVEDVEDAVTTVLRKEIRMELVWESKSSGLTQAERRTGE